MNVAATAAARLRILVLGYIVRGPLGGLAWHHLQYVLGLRALGHDVFFIEDSDDYPGCYDPETMSLSCDPTYGLAFAEQVFGRFDLNACWAYYDAHAGSCWRGGPGANQAETFARSADIVLNLSGMNPLRDFWADSPLRIFVDTDPVFTQIRHLTDPAAQSLAAAHHAFFSFGENIGRGDCTVPDDGFDWQPTRQPVALRAWPVTLPPAVMATDGGLERAFTTVMQWDSYAAKTWAGRCYDMKSASFAAYADLPGRLPEQRFEIALGSRGAPRDQLTDQGWRLRDSLRVTRTLETYQQYLQESLAEFSVAKHGYVAARSGWFSERSAAYLASGRPVVVQDTGFCAHLPVGKGLMAFSTLAQAIEAIAAVRADYAGHCRAARQVAEEYFQAEDVLQRLLNAAQSSQAAGRC